MHSRIFAAYIGLALFGCQAASPLVSPVSVDNVTSGWLIGSVDEPAAGPVAGCYPREVWQLEQKGEQVTATLDRCVGPCEPSPESAQGTNRAGRLQLEGTYQLAGSNQPPERVVYDLTYNPQTRHLTGTRNGRPFWAAPFVRKSSEDCGPAIL